LSTPLLRYKAVWLSDIHLGFRDCRADYLLDFLNSVDCETLYLVGDIVDLWSLKKRFFWPAAHYDVLRAILKKSRHGTRVVYIPGNHDEPLRDYVGESLGAVEIKHEVVHTTADGRKLLVFHGDVLDPHIRLNRLEHLVGDVAYDFLLFLNRWGNFIRSRLGLGYWSLATYIKRRVKNARQVIDVYEQAAVQEAQRRGLDGVICGHIHQPGMRIINGIVYCNDGDWIESCSALTETDTGELQLLHWSDRQRIVREFNSQVGLHEADVIPLRKAG
jgi:UDP-2,3-diacylglucosamine pyrophosphatase LpxH